MMQLASAFRARSPEARASIADLSSHPRRSRSPSVLLSAANASNTSTSTDDERATTTTTATTTKPARKEGALPYEEQRRFDSVQCPGCNLRMMRSLSFEQVKRHLDACCPNFFAESGASVRVFHITWLVLQARVRMMDAHQARGELSLAGVKRRRLDVNEHEMLTSTVRPRRFSATTSKTSSPASTERYEPDNLPDGVEQESAVRLMFVSNKAPATSGIGCRSCHKNSGWLRVCGHCHQQFHVRCDRMDIMTADNRLLVEDPLCFSCATRAGSMLIPGKSALQKHWSNHINNEEMHEHHHQQQQHDVKQIH